MGLRDWGVCLYGAGAIERVMNEMIEVKEEYNFSAAHPFLRLSLASSIFCIFPTLSFTVRVLFTQ